MNPTRIIVNLAIATACGLLAACALMEPPRPSITFNNTRVSVYSHEYLSSEEDGQTTDTLQKSTAKPVAGDNWGVKAVWPDNFVAEITAGEKYQPHESKEILAERDWTLNVSGGSETAMLYGMNQTDKAAAASTAWVNAAAAIATAGASEVDDIFANAAAAIGTALANKEVTRNEADVLLAKLGQVRSAREAELAEAARQKEIDALKAEVETLKTAADEKETSFDTDPTVETKF